MIKVYTEITAENFESEVIGSKIPTVVDFWAEWCGPCRMLAPIIEEISEERDDIKVCKVNVDEQNDLANRFEVSAIPTVILFKDGKPAAQSLGYKDKDALIAALGL